MSKTAKILSVTTAVPPFCLEQRDVATAANEAFAHRYGAYRSISRVFESSGILRRYAVRPLEWYFEPLGWAERNQAYLDGAVKLFIEAASKAVEAA